MNKFPCRKSSAGFTLLEIAVVLFIVGLMIAGLLGPLETQLESRDRRQTQETLNQIVDALYGFAMTNGRLPCADTDGDGTADPDFNATDESTAECNGTTFGFVPWADLGVAQGDAWSNRIAYAVSAPAYTWPDTDGLCNGGADQFDLCATGSLEVLTRGDNPLTAGVREGKHELTNASAVPAVLVSYGRNGNGATAVNGGARPAPSGADEIENTAGDPGRFIARGYSRGTSDCDDTTEAKSFCEFDDIVVWLAPTILNARMVSAGRLP
jgi:type II secretory pathway pseudopilin PulG